MFGSHWSVNRNQVIELVGNPLDHVRTMAKYLDRELDKKLYQIHLINPPPHQIFVIVSQFVVVL